MLFVQTGEIRSAFSVDLLNVAVRDVAVEVLGLDKVLQGRSWSGRVASGSSSVRLSGL